MQTNKPVLTDVLLMLVITSYSIHYTKLYDTTKASMRRTSLRTGLFVCISRNTVQIQAKKNTGMASRGMIAPAYWITIEAILLPQRAATSGDCPCRRAAR